MMNCRCQLSSHYIHCRNIAALGPANGNTTGHELPRKTGPDVEDVGRIKELASASDDAPATQTESANQPIPFLKLHTHKPELRFARSGLQRCQFELKAG